MSDSSKRAVTLHFKNEEKLNIYPSYGLRKMLKEDAADNLESMSKTALKIIKSHYEKHPLRKKNQLP